MAVAILGKNRININLFLSTETLQIAISVYMKIKSHSR